MQPVKNVTLLWSRSIFRRASFLMPPEWNRCASSISNLPRISLLLGVGLWGRFIAWTSFLVKCFPLARWDVRAACCRLVAERGGKMKVKVMNTSEQVLLNIFILCFLSFAMMDYAPQACGVPATLFVAAGKYNGETGIWKWQSSEIQICMWASLALCSAWTNGRRRRAKSEFLPPSERTN